MTLISCSHQATWPSRLSPSFQAQLSLNLHSLMHLFTHPWVTYLLSTCYLYQRHGCSDRDEQDKTSASSAGDRPAAANHIIGYCIKTGGGGRKDNAQASHKWLPLESLLYFLTVEPAIYCLVLLKCFLSVRTVSESGLWAGIWDPKPPLPHFHPEQNVGLSPRENTFLDQHLSLGNGNWEMSQRLKEVAFQLGITQD